MIKLYNGDCLEIMDRFISDGVIVDAIITDPPYGMSFQSNHRKIKHDKIINDSNLDWLDDFVEKCFKLARANSAHYFFCSFHNVDIFKQCIQKYFKIKDILVWEKNNTGMGDLKGSFAPKLEFIIFAQKGRTLIRGGRTPNIFKFARTNNLNHPTEKPVLLMEHLISKFTDENQTILDPFMGSGTTGVACKNLNRKFIGVEMDKNYFEIAENRIYDMDFLL